MKYDRQTPEMRRARGRCAPCRPIEGDDRMVGPVLQEYYASSRGNGFCTSRREEWLKKPVRSGRRRSALKICDENSDEVAVGTDGTVYFADGTPFVYHNDPEKTAQSKNKHGWTTLGDVSHVDEDGYLFSPTARPS